MAKILTFPEVVTNKNIDILRKLVINGPDNHPGALYILKSDGKDKFHLGIANRRKLADGL